MDELLPPLHTGHRAAELQTAVSARGLDGFVATCPQSVRWLTGFTGSNGYVAVTEHGVTLLTDQRYGERAAAELAAANCAAEIVVCPTLSAQDDALRAALDGCFAVGGEAGRTTHLRWQALSASIGLTPADQVITELRRTKDHAEIQRIQRCADIADRALAKVAPLLGEGYSEREIARQLDQVMLDLGADGSGYDTIVAAGPVNAARPHHEPGDYVIVAGDLVVIDVGACLDGYRSDMTRTFVVGEPSAQHTELYNALLAAQQAGIAAVEPGVPASHIDDVCRSACAEAGFGDWYLHSTGHGVGLEIHEQPFLAPSATTNLRVGDVVTVEPGLYRVDIGGLRIEDLVEVTNDGCRILTKTPKDSPCLPSQPTT